VCGAEPDVFGATVGIFPTSNKGCPIPNKKHQLKKSSKFFLRGYYFDRSGFVSRNDSTLDDMFKKNNVKRREHRGRKFSPII
jgi:hypothetical protein